MKAIQKTGVKLGKLIIEIISAQIIKYLTSEEFKNRVNKMLDETINLMVKVVIKESKSSKQVWNKKPFDLGILFFIPTVLRSE